MKTNRNYIRKAIVSIPVLGDPTWDKESRASKSRNSTSYAIFAVSLLEKEKQWSQDIPDMAIYMRTSQYSVGYTQCHQAMNADMNLKVRHAIEWINNITEQYVL